MLLSLPCRCDLHIPDAEPVRIDRELGVAFVEAD